MNGNASALNGVAQPPPAVENNLLACILTGEGACATNDFTFRLRSRLRHCHE